MILAWRWLIGAALVATALAALPGCAGVPSVASNDRIDSVSGRLSVRIASEPERGVNAGFELIGTAIEGRLLLSGPLGATAAQARWSRGQAWLAVGGVETSYADLDLLTFAALGERIPMAALFDWLRGRPWPGAPAAARSDGMPGFDQLGWQVGLARWPEGWVEAYRPAKLSQPAVTVRVRLEPAA